MLFADCWDTADKEFIDPRMEGARKELHAKARAAASNIARYTSPHRQAEGLQTVRLRHFSEDDQPARIWEEAAIINTSAREFAKSYSNLIRLGKSAAGGQRRCVVTALSFCANAAYCLLALSLQDGAPS
jgi:hypothetical protein